VTPELRVTIAGAGIGGLAAALELAGQGIAATMIEHAPRDTGRRR